MLKQLFRFEISRIKAVVTRVVVSTRGATRGHGQQRVRLTFR